MLVAESAESADPIALKETRVQSIESAFSLPPGLPFNAGDDKFREVGLVSKRIELALDL